MSRFLVNATPQTIGNYFDVKDEVLMRPDYNRSERYNFWMAAENLWPRSRFQGSDLSIALNRVEFSQRMVGNAWDIRSGGKYTLLYKIEGQCKDPNDVAYGDCTAILFRTSDRLMVDSVAADAAGYFLLYTPYTTDTHFVACFNSDGTVAGLTINTLIPVA